MKKMEKNEITLAKYVEEIFFKKAKKNDCNENNNQDSKIRIGIDANLINHGKIIHFYIDLYLNNK